VILYQLQMLDASEYDMKYFRMVSCKEDLSKLP